MKGSKNALSKKRQDAKDLLEILDKIPEERKGEVLGIVRGFALCAENERYFLGVAESVASADEKRKQGKGVN